MDVHKKYNCMVSVHTDAQWVKPAWPAELILLTLTLLMGPFRAMPGGPARILCEAQFCLCFCLKSFKTVGGIHIKLGIMDHLFRVSAIRGFVTSR